MSLFRLREWWTFNSGDDSSECSSGSLCAVKLGENNTDLIVVGSLSGVVRIFDVTSGGAFSDDSTSSASLTGYKAENLLLEKQLDYPVLQISAGLYVSSSDKKHLAILHPRKLAIYRFGSVGAGQVAYGYQYDLDLVYEHFLQRTAYNFIDGPFGNISNRDFLCVQSLDGTLSIYEQENFAFTRFLPGAMLPGPLAYVRRSDSFVTASSSWQVESYKYQVLAVAADAKTKEDAEKSTSGKRVMMDWCYRMGEMVLSVQAVEISPAPPSILVLGERSVVCLTEGGQLRFMKKLEYEPSCLFVYGATSEGFLQWVVGSHTNTLLFYADTTAKWGAQTTFIPVAIHTASFGYARNMIVALSELGSVSCAYLGTDPALYGITVTDRRNLDYAAKQQELRHLQSLIKMSKSNLDLTKKKQGAEELRLVCNMPSKLDHQSMGYDTTFSDITNISVTAQITINCGQTVHNVRIITTPPAPVISQPASFMVDCLRETESFPITFSLKNDATPAHLRVMFQTSYNSPGGPEKIFRTSGYLPLTLIARLCETPKSAVHKITVDSNKPLVNLNELFPDFMPSGSTGQLTSIGFQLHGRKPALVGILASKQSQKYRVQTDNFEQISVFLHELITRLNRYYTGDNAFQLTYTGALPLAEYFTLIDQHFELYRRKVKLYDTLAQKAAQFRATERQLLIKLHESTPSPVSHFDALIEMTFRQIMSVASSIQDLDEALRILRTKLNAGTYLLVTLAELLYQLTPSERLVLDSIFYVDSEELGDQAWEEQVDAALVYVLQMMSKGGSAAPQPASTPALQQLADNTRLKKHIVLLNEKLSKGSKLPPLATVRSAIEDKAGTSKAKHNAVPGGKIAGPRALEPIAEDTNWNDVAESRLGDAEVPAGSAFGEFSNEIEQQIVEADTANDATANDDPNFRPSTASSRRFAVENDDENERFSSSKERVRSAARARSRSAGKSRSATVTSEDAAENDQGKPKRKSTDTERIESEPLVNAEDEANGFF